MNFEKRSVFLLAVILSTACVQVKEEWVVRHDGPGNANDVATAIALDGSGNVYVTGGSGGSLDDNDYATIKYDPQGNQQWVAYYNGPGDGSDQALAIAVDSSGNSYITGWSENLSENLDYVTIKYNPQGAEQWVARYNSPDNVWDFAVALAVDYSDNVYVTGFTSYLTLYSSYTTIKYNQHGEEQWVARYEGQEGSVNEAAALAVDKMSNIYVTGLSYDSTSKPDYLTIKYNSQGSEEWVSRYDGPGHDVDKPVAVEVDDIGNVYVTGMSKNEAGGYDCATVKYSPEGQELWVARYYGSVNSHDEVIGSTALALDSQGNIYVAGSSEGSTSGLDYCTIKYNAQGQELWVTRYNGQGNGKDQAIALTTDSSGNVYVTGSSNSSDSTKQYTTVKYNAKGLKQWVASYNGSGNSQNQALALVVDSSDNVYVTGASGEILDLDYCTIKYSQR
ncbi:SBBP repeat-containing protein [candidate division WOR-3 bacterium]|nr:SBBP repeat-containing protein [candidate division WOR-3 bacterium]